MDLTTLLSIMCLERRQATFDFSGQSALIAGGAGFLGSHLCAVLRLAGADVHLASRSLQPGEFQGIRLWQSDLSQFGATRSLLQATRPDVIFHLCGHGIGSPDLEYVLPVFQNDLESAVNMLTAATELGIRKLILAASLEEPQLPNDDDIPSTPYAAAKWAGNSYVRMFHLLYRTPVTMVRPYMTYGPGQARHKIIPSVILSFARGEAPKLSSGKRPVDWVYVDDVIDGMLAAANFAGTECETFDLGSGQLVPIRDVVLKIAALFGDGLSPAFGALPDRPQERVRVADISGTRSKLNWSPRIGLDEGLRRTVDWYRQHPDFVR